MSRRTRGHDVLLASSAQLSTHGGPPFRFLSTCPAAPVADAAPRVRPLRSTVHVAAVVAPPRAGVAAGREPAGPAPDVAEAARLPEPAGTVETEIADAAGCGDADALWRAYLAGPNRALRDRLVEHYTPLLRAVAQRVGSGLPSYVELADLVQCGVFGLVDAVERFDPARCPRFESYAVQRIRGAILDELRAFDWVPRSVRGRARELDRAQERLEGRLRRAATDRELAAELGLPVGEMRALTRTQMISMEALDEDSGGVSELLAADPDGDPMAVVQSRETLRLLAAAVGQLGERDRLVVRLYYLENRTLAEIGRRLGVTESRVCQLHTRLVGRLRGWMEELAGG